jgi:hypothetical protein
MEKKKTATQWIIDQLLFAGCLTQKPESSSINGLKVLKIFNQALEMEKEQHGTTWDDALKQVEKRTVWARAMCDFDEYYEETYKK